MMIDIRDENERNVDRIKFSSNDDLVVATVLWNSAEGRIRFLDDEGAADQTVAIEDIDNLIKALKKAKELWE